MEKIIDFKSEKEKVRDSDIQKTEEFLYNAMSEMAYGNLNILDFTEQMNAFMKENSMSIKKFDEVQKIILKKHGIDLDSVEGRKVLQEHLSPSEQKEFKTFLDAMDKSNFGEEEEIVYENPDDMEEIKKLGFYVQYEDLVKDVHIEELELKNEKNNLRILIDENRLTIISEGKIDLSDEKLNEIIATYKSTSKKKLRVILCEATNAYDYE